MKITKLLPFCTLLIGCASFIHYAKNPTVDITATKQLLNYEVYIRENGFETFSHSSNFDFISYIENEGEYDKSKSCKVYRRAKLSSEKFKQHMYHIFSDLRQTELHKKLVLENYMFPNDIEDVYISRVRNLVRESKLRMIWLSDDKICIKIPRLR